MVHIVGNNSCIFLLRREDSKVEVNITFWMCSAYVFYYLSKHHTSVWMKYFNILFQTLIIVSAKRQKNTHNAFVS
jgi:hypothetical protein